MGAIQNAPEHGPVVRRREEYPTFRFFRAESGRSTCGLCRSAILARVHRAWCDPETRLMFHHDCAVRAWKRAQADMRRGC